MTQYTHNNTKATHGLNEHILSVSIMLNKNHVPNYEMPKEEQIVVDQTVWAKSWLVPNCSRLGDDVLVAVYLPEHTGQNLYLTVDYRTSIADYYTEGLYIHFYEEQIGRVVVTAIRGEEYVN